MSLAWSAPASNGGSAIAGYDVYEGTSAGGESFTPVNGATYYLTVEAVNAAGHSLASNEASATPVRPPPVTAPSPPRSLVATPGNTQVSLSWGAPSSDGGSAVTGYDVFEGTTSGGESSTPVNSSPLSATSTSHTVSGLTNGTTYFFTVKTVNAAGASPASNQSRGGSARR
ncbi:MAG: fibronectin type III domain-containing protein [Acidimicrobiales bacterium]